MILTKGPLLHTPLWQQELARAVTCRRELLRRLGLPPPEDPEHSPEEGFPLRVPESFISRMEPGNPRDPLLLQVLPQEQERLSPPGYHTDPVGDGEALAAPGLLHKYHGRVLLVAGRSCALHCRFCFRRHFPYREAAPHSDRWDAALEYIAADPTISEVILSGGDPLTLSDGRLARLAAGLDSIPHLRRIRIHSRLPVVLPSRVSDPLLEWLGRTRLQPVVVIHANHPNEIDGEVGQALRRLAAAGIMLLNQTVLLRGINDRAETLAALSETLWQARVAPYYLHLLDRVQGAAHFATGASRARALHRRMRDMLPGYLIPRLVRERAGAPAKLAL